jgi:hypothetical protein
MEFIAARNGTSGAGSSSPVFEKCSNSSAKDRKRYRSSSPCGSMSVDSIFLMTDIGGARAGSGATIWPPGNERGLKAAQS